MTQQEYDIRVDELQRRRDQRLMAVIRTAASENHRTYTAHAQALIAVAAAYLEAAVMYEHESSVAPSIHQASAKTT